MLSARLREAAVWGTVAEVVQGAPANEGVIRLRRTGDASYQPFHFGAQMEQKWAGYLGQVAQKDDRGCR